MKKGLIGKKIGMTQIFDEKGMIIPVTVIRSRTMCSSTSKNSRNMMDTMLYN